MNDRITDDPGGAGECHYPVGKARTSLSTTFFFKLGGTTFLPNFDSSFTILYCLGNVQKFLVPETAFKYICVALGGGSAEKIRTVSECSSEIPSSKPYRIIFKRSTKNVFFQ